MRLNKTKLMRSNKKIKLLLVGFICAFLVLSNLSSVLAQEDPNEIEASENVKVPVISEEEKKNEIFLIQMRQILNNSRNDYFQISGNITIAKERLVESQHNITTLKDQIENFNYLISNTETKIRNVEKQIAQKENRIDVLEEDLKIKEIELKNQIIFLKEYLKLLYFQENAFYENGTQNVNIAKLLLGEETIGETFQQIEYFNILEQTGHNIFSKIEEIRVDLILDKDEIEATKSKLARLKNNLLDEKKNLQLQKHSKSKLLEKTKGEEEIYRELIIQSKLEQINLINEINALKENLAFIQQKIDEEGDEFDPDNYSNMINPNVRAVYDFELSAEFLEGEKINWPIKPSLGISAYFRDSGYLALFGIPHNAIDIPTNHGTAIHSPAPGVVYKVKDNGDTSYSYVIIAHKGGLLTVYGHVSEVLVRERDIVLPGEVIALTGGTPGSKGAGFLTTGAHLHFEVIKNGVNIDPLLVLPLEELGGFEAKEEEVEPVAVKVK